MLAPSPLARVPAAADHSQITIHVEALHFDGFDAAFAERARAAFTARWQQIPPQQIAALYAGRGAVDLGDLCLEGMDFTTAETLGAMLADRILQALSQQIGARSQAGVT